MVMIGSRMRSSGGGSVQLDDSVTRSSSNGVKSSGIWSAIWGALAALPTGFSSLYDWCAAQVAEKADASALLPPVFAAKTSGSYEHGELVLYNNTAYKRNDTAGDDTSWVSAHWTSATDADLAARLNGLKSDGTVTDDFATDLLGKQVAKEALSKGYAFFDLVPVTEGGFKVFAAKDRAINRFTLADATPVKVILPNATDANGRDFILKVNVTSATMPTFEIVKPSDAASVGIEAADDGWADLEAGINYFTITETDRA